MMSPIAVLAFTPSGRDAPVGVATPVSSELLLTCVHVLRAGRYPRREGVQIRLRFGQQTEILQAKLLACPWVEDGPDWPDEELPPGLDVVALHLPKPITSELPTARSLDRADAGAEMIAYGFPTDGAAGREARFRVAAMLDTRGLLQLNWRPGEFPVELGFSGGPVWDGKGSTVGMIVLRWRPDDSDRISPHMGFMVPLTAISDLFKQHSVTGFSIEPAVLAKYKGARKLVKWAKDRLDENPYHKRRKTALLPISFAVGKEKQARELVFTNIERLHSGDDNALLDFDQLTPAELCSGRGSDHYYVQAPGGSGKSFALYELVMASVAWGTLPVLINTVEGGASITRAFGESTVKEKLEALFDECVSMVGFDFFQKARENDDPVLLIIDGLNEASTDVDKIINLAVNTANNFANVRVVIVDRMTLRRDHGDFFRLATVAPLAADTVQPVIPDFAGSDADFQRLLRIPFFLDLFRESEDAKPGKRTRILQEYVGWLLKDQQGGQNQAAQAERALRALAKIAFEAYRGGGQTLTSEMFRSVAVKLDPQWLADRGLLRKSSGASAFVFRHQLVHDFLASQHFLTERMDADTTNLNILTLSRRSWDALVLALEDLSAVEADKLLVDIYNWDHGVTLSCLVETRYDPNDALATAICAVLSEKLEDTFLHTRRRTQERVWALKRFLGTEGDLSLAVTLAQIRGAENRFLETPLHQWWLAFTAEAVTPELWRALIGVDPLAGWSAATAFRRILSQTDDPESAPVLELLLILYDALRNQAGPGMPGPIRWRIVHVLGRFRQAVSQLISIGCDSGENDDIRYGAFREVIEIAARSPSQEGARILAALAGNIGAAPVSTRALSAFRSCAILKERSSEEPGWWRDKYRPLLRKAMSLVQKSDGDYAMWEAQKERFEADERQKSI